MIARLVGRSLAALAALATLAHAHDRSVSYSTWRLDGRRADVVLRLTRLELTHLPWWSDHDAEDRFGTYAQDRLRLFAGDVPCSPNGAAHPVPATENWLAVGWSVTCPAAGALHLESTLLLDVAPTHLHLARVSDGSAAPVELALAGGTRSPALAGGRGGADAGVGPGGWLARGLAHVAVGRDQLALLAVLLLLVERADAAARIVAAFLVGQSVTLALGALGWANTDPIAVGALAGLSVALVAAENVWLIGGRGAGVARGVVIGVGGLAVAAARGYGAVPLLALGGVALAVACWFGLLARSPRPERGRWTVALLFGLLHGFGLADALVRAELPAMRLAPALFGFNAGLVAGQLAFVALLWPLWRRLARSERRRPFAIEAGSAVAAGVGLFWFVTRAFG